MPSNSAEYMREYRARKKAAHEDYDAAKPTIRRIKTECVERIAELEAEVRYLKAELAKRPAPLPERQRRINALDERIARGDASSEEVEEFGRLIPGGFNTRPFTPVPKRK